MADAEQNQIPAPNSTHDVPGDCHARALNALNDGAHGLALLRLSAAHSRELSRQVFERMEAMADGVLLLGRELGHGLAGRIGGQEQRVIAKAVAPAPLARDHALAGPRAREDAACGVDERHDAHEARRTVGVCHFPCILSRELGVVGLVITMGAGVARRVNAGLTVERVHHQAGIVGDSRQARRRDGGLGLDDRVLDNVVPFSSGSSNISQLAERHKPNVGQDLAEDRPRLSVSLCALPVATTMVRLESSVSMSIFSSVIRGLPLDV